MNARTPTPEEFLTTPTSTDEDEDTTPVDPLTSIAESLHVVATAITRQEGISQAEVDRDFRVNMAEAARDDMEAQLYEVNGQIEAVLALCKPSTSKLANAIRAALAPPARVEDDAPDEEDEPHAFVSDDGVDSCRLCGRFEDDGQSIHVSDDQPRDLPEGVYVSPSAGAEITVAGAVLPVTGQ